MILTGYSILSLFLCVLRLILGMLVLACAVPAWRQAKRPRSVDETEMLENRFYLLLLATGVLVGLNALSWPVIYLLLQSHVQEWPSIMCIYGVLRIGESTTGTSRFLPSLLAVLQWTKPLVVFLSGLAALLYVLNRQTRTSPFRKRLIGLIVGVAAVTVADCGLEGAWIAIPKREIQLAGGCCTAAIDSVQQSSKFTRRAVIPSSARPVLIGVYYVLNSAVMTALLLRIVLAPTRWSRPLDWFSQGAVAGLIPVAWLFLCEIASPAILGLPFHYCPYDLIEYAPESVLSLVLFPIGCFCVFWSGLLQLFAESDQTGALRVLFCARLSFLSLCALSSSTIILTIEWLLS